MKTILTILMAAITFVSANAYKYSYSFDNTPISEAIVKISKANPDVNISFIYKELDNYKTSANIHTDNAYDALRSTIGINPISVIKKGNHYYVEALQHGNYTFSGRVIITISKPYGEDGEIKLMTRDNFPKIHSIRAFLGSSFKAGIWEPRINLGITKQWFDIDTPPRASSRRSPPCLLVLCASFSSPIPHLHNKNTPCSVVSVVYETGGINFKVSYQASVSPFGPSNSLGASAER